MRSVTNFNDGWLFEGKAVHLPHTAVELPFAYFDERDYQRAFTYEKSFDPDPSWAGKEVSLVFEGAMADSTVSLNGEPLAAHKDGYTPFEVRLTGKLKAGKNTLTVRIDGSENPHIPPFGGLIDYLTYAGIYRDVWLKVTAPVSIGRVKIDTPNVLAAKKSVHAAVELINPQGGELAGTVAATIRNTAGAVVAKLNAHASPCVRFAFDNLEHIALWDIADPNLYTLELTLGADALITTFGFRSAEFTPGGFRLNGKPLKLRGLNRHQSFPYSGYAMGRAAQERDAQILKHELHLNMVRTSHYPQSPWFLDECDRLGLLVFEEIPGWQHIGGDAWKVESVENVRRMIRRDWNHPSIVIWGVRINESQDSHDFYLETNRVAHELDSTRQTGGVRYITDSELLEDVYTMNDFILGNEELGGNRPRTPLRPRTETTGLDRPVPYMITEYGGHMFPTKIYDQEQRQAEHVRRHLEVLNAAYGDPQISGSIGWCAFDYNTHKDFGSGDRICHHGVMDMFREPKFAAYVYASQCEPSEAIVFKPVTIWARGERNIGGVLPLIILTNCDEVELRAGKLVSKRFTPDRKSFPHLPHAPVIIEPADLSSSELSLWGWVWQDSEIVGYIGGKQVATQRFAANPVATTLEVVADATHISADRRDEVRVAVRALDQVGNKLPFMFDPITITVAGPADLIGPSQPPLRGGATGFWLRCTGTRGKITASVSSQRFGTKTIELVAE